MISQWHESPLIFVYLLRAGADAYERGLHGQALIKPTQDQSHYISRLNSPMDALQWMGAIRMIADKNLTIIHSTPVHQWTSGEDKRWNTSSIKMILRWWDWSFDDNDDKKLPASGHSRK